MTPFEYVDLILHKTKAEYELSLIVPQKDGETNWAKECIKSAIKAKLKDKDKEFTTKYGVLFDKIAKEDIIVVIKPTDIITNKADFTIVLINSFWLFFI